MQKFLFKQNAPFTYLDRSNIFMSLFTEKRAGFILPKSEMLLNSATS